MTAVKMTVTSRALAGADVFDLRGHVRHGNSGGPLILSTGEVGGVLSRGTPRAGVAVAVAPNEVVPFVERAHDRTRPVATGSCPAR